MPFIFKMLTLHLSPMKAEHMSKKTLGWKNSQFEQSNSLRVRQSFSRWPRILPCISSSKYMFVIPTLRSLMLNCIPPTRSLKSEIGCWKSTLLNTSVSMSCFLVRKTFSTVTALVENVTSSNRRWIIPLLGVCCYVWNNSSIPFISSLWAFTVFIKTCCACFSLFCC